MDSAVLFPCLGMLTGGHLTSAFHLDFNDEEKTRCLMLSINMTIKNNLQLSDDGARL